jgi:hypothetical protein
VVLKVGVVAASVLAVIAIGADGYAFCEQHQANKKAHEAVVAQTKEKSQREIAEAATKEAEAETKVAEKATSIPGSASPAGAPTAISLGTNGVSISPTSSTARPFPTYLFHRMCLRTMPPHRRPRRSNVAMP